MDPEQVVRAFMDDVLNGHNGDHDRLDAIQHAAAGGRRPEPHIGPGQAQHDEHRWADKAHPADQQPQPSGPAAGPSAAPRQHRRSMVRRCCAATFQPRTPRCSSSDRCCHHRLPNPHTAAITCCWHCQGRLRDRAAPDPCPGKQDRDFVPAFTSGYRGRLAGQRYQPRNQFASGSRGRHS